MVAVYLVFAPFKAVAPTLDQLPSLAAAAILGYDLAATAFLGLCASGGENSDSCRIYRLCLGLPVRLAGICGRGYRSYSGRDRTHCRWVSGCHAAKAGSGRPCRNHSSLASTNEQLFVLDKYICLVAAALCAAPARATEWELVYEADNLRVQRRDYAGFRAGRDSGSRPGKSHAKRGYGLAERCPISIGTGSTAAAAPVFCRIQAMPRRMCTALSMRLFQ